MPATATKYFSVFSDGTNDYQVRDAESVALMLSVIDSMEIDETTGDVTISYDDGTEEEEESE